MRLAEALGSSVSILLFLALLYSLAISQFKPPKLVKEELVMKRLIEIDIGKLGLYIGSYAWNNFFPILIAFTLVLLTLVLGIVALLRRV